MAFSRFLGCAFFSPRRAERAHCRRSHARQVPVSLPPLRRQARWRGGGASPRAETSTRRRGSSTGCALSCLRPSRAGTTSWCTASRASTGALFWALPSTAASLARARGLRDFGKSLGAGEAKKSAAERNGNGAGEEERRESEKKERGRGRGVRREAKFSSSSPGFPGLPLHPAPHLVGSPVAVPRPGPSQGRWLGVGC